MIKRFSQFVAVFAALIAVVSNGAPAPAQSIPRIDVHGDEFAALRDPFWPVGYNPLPEEEKIEQTKIADLKARINWPALPLRGITHGVGKRFIAIIDGVGLVEAGDIVVIEQDGLIYRWIIDKVSADGINSTRLDVTGKVQN